MKYNLLQACIFHLNLAGKVLHPVWYCLLRTGSGWQGMTKVCWRAYTPIKYYLARDSGFKIQDSRFKIEKEKHEDEFQKQVPDFRKSNTCLQ